MCSPKRELETGAEDQSTAMENSCSKDLNKLSFQYLPIIKENIFICLYGDNASNGKLLPMVKLEGRTLPWKDLLAALFWEDSQSWALKDHKTGKWNVEKKVGKEDVKGFR